MLRHRPQQTAASLLSRSQEQGDSNNRVSDRNPHEDFQRGDAALLASFVTSWRTVCAPRDAIKIGSPFFCRLTLTDMRGMTQSL